MLANPPEISSCDDQIKEDIKNSLIARSEREIKTMNECKSDYLVRVGPIPFKCVDYNDQTIILFTEEFIDGNDLSEEIKKSGPADIHCAINLGLNIAEAIDVLKNCNKLHRDIKPLNIIKRKDSDTFVLLDLGIVFDFEDESLTKYGDFVPGSKLYYSPEHLDFKRRREMDFRSDLFCLGVTMYEYLLGIHPFMKARTSFPEDLFRNILTMNPLSPKDIRPEVPNELSVAIVRLLAKQPHGRYRTPKLFIDTLKAISR